MRVYCLFLRDPLYHEDMPYLVDAVDEYTVDSLNDFPEDYVKQREDPNTRELVLVIPDKAVEDLFEAPEVRAEVVDA